MTPHAAGRHPAVRDTPRKLAAGLTGCGDSGIPPGDDSETSVRFGAA